MNLFQLLTLSVVTAVLAAEFLGLCRRSAGRKLRLLRIAAWSAAAAAIVDPGIPQAVAIRIGIGRGADLVLYLVVLVFLGGSFYFYSCFVRLERQLTEVVSYGDAKCTSGATAGRELTVRAGASPQSMDVNQDVTWLMVVFVTYSL